MSHCLPLVPTIVGPLGGGSNMKQVKAANITKFKRSAGSSPQKYLVSNYTCTVQHFS